ncbi:hypothetical protein BH23BAC3_BH23BAC3_12500 [soil metagenome]
MHKYLKTLPKYFVKPLFSFIFLILFSCILLVTNSFAQQSITGVYQNYTAFQLYNEHELIAGRNRLRTQFSHSFTSGEVYAEIDLIDSYANNREFEVLPRELYADWYTTHYDIRIGKQKIIWGQATGAFVNDILTPVDLSDFLTQDLDDLRIGINAINIHRYFGSNYIQMVVAPALQPDRLPKPDSRWFPVQQPADFLPVSFRSSNVQPSLSDLQLAARFAWRPTTLLDADFMLYHWAHPMPAYAISTQFPSFPELPEIILRETYKTSPMAGLSLTWRASDRWILSAEGLYVNERLFTYLPVPVNRLEEALADPVVAFQVLQEFQFRDDGYILSKPWLQQMIGVQTDVRGNTIGAQGYLEVIFNYEDRILPQRFFPYATGFVQRTFMRERLNALITGRYNFFGEDFWVQIQTGYEIRDGFELKLGTNFFGGPTVSPFYGHLTFEQFYENSFLFAQTSIYF